MFFTIGLTAQDWCGSCSLGNTLGTLLNICLGVVFVNATYEHAAYNSQCTLGAGLRPSFFQTNDIYSWNSWIGWLAYVTKDIRRIRSSHWNRPEICPTIQILALQLRLMHKVPHRQPFLPAFILHDFNVTLLIHSFDLLFCLNPPRDGSPSNEVSKRLQPR